MKYLVSATGGPGFGSPQEAVHLLEKFVLPTLDLLVKMESEKKVLGGGLPVGERALIFIMEASSHEEVDQFLQKLPLWSWLDWEVTALQTFEKRAAQDRDILQGFK